MVIIFTYFIVVPLVPIQLFLIARFQKYFSAIKDNFPLQQKQERMKMASSFLNLIVLLILKIHCHPIH